MTGKSEPSIAVLQVIYHLDRGGIELTLLNILRKIDKNRFNIDIAVHDNHKGVLEEEFHALGCRIFHLPHPRKIVTYRRSLRKLLSSYGPYRVVHSHVHLHSGIVLSEAKKAGVPIRIAHSRLDLSPTRSTESWKKSIFRALMSRAIKASATHRRASSFRAGADLFGEQWLTFPTSKVFLCPLDFSSFEHPYSKEQARSLLGLPLEAPVFGHIGRFFEQKNHRFLITVFQHILTKLPDAHLILIGEGPLLPDIQNVVRSERIPQVHFSPPRSDIAQLLRGAFDVMLFPSLYEGLGIVGVEAQAAGIPLVLSDTIPAEIELIPSLLTRVSLTTSPDLWAEHSIKAFFKGPQEYKDSLSQVQQSDFNVTHALSDWARLFEEGTTFSHPLN